MPKCCVANKMQERESGIEAAELPGPIYQTANQGLERLTEFCHISALVWSQ